MDSHVTGTPVITGGTLALPHDVIDFLNGLRRLPVGEWSRAAMAAARPADLPQRNRSSATEAAHARLRRVAATQPGLAAQLQLRVTHLVEVARGMIGEDEADAMRRIAFGAALAVAVRPALGEEAFAELHAPFAALIPIADTADVPQEASSAA